MTIAIFAYVIHEGITLAMHTARLLYFSSVVQRKDLAGGTPALPAKAPHQWPSAYLRRKDWERRRPAGLAVVPLEHYG